MKDFTELSIKETLTAYLSENDYQNYCVKIHGFKNNAYSVGAKAIGDLAYEMERHTKNEFTDEINVLQNRLFEQYDRVCQQYNRIVK